jgi:hypothetical protein
MSTQQSSTQEKRMKQKAFRKELLLQIGPIQTTVDLLSVVPSSRTQAKRICPDHKLALKQQYKCPDEDNPHTVQWGQWDSAVQTPEGWRKVNPDERPSLEAASKVLELTPVPASEIADNTFEDDSIYWLRPSNEASLSTWTILVRQMKTGKTAFITRGGFKKGGVERLWKLELFRGHPVLRAIRFPHTINDAPEAETVTVDKETQKLVNEFIKARMSSWDDVDTTDRFEAALNEWVSGGELITVSEEASDEPKQTHEDMIAALQEAVKAAQKS